MKKNFYTIFSIVFLFIPIISFAQVEQGTANEAHEDSNKFIGLNSQLTYDMMEPNQNLRKVEILIDTKSDEKILNRSLSFGFSTIGIVDYQNSNRDSKFAYLMRHPTSNNQIGETVSEVVIHSAQLSFIGSINNWLTAYGELLYSPEQSFGSGTITSLGRNQVEFRKGILLIGNLDRFPLYLAVGKMDTPFGQTGSVSPFTNSTMWHAFGGLGYSGVLGFKKYGLSASFTAIQGGAQFRALNVPVDSTSVPSRINNFALDLNYTISLNTDLSVNVGASYLKGSAYCQPFPVVHFMPCSNNNPAFSFYGNINYKNKIFLKGSFAQTENEWPGTFNPTPPLNQFSASKVSSMDIGAKYVINDSGKVQYAVSAEFSNFKAGPSGAPWERQSQTVIGFNAQVENTSRLFLEFFRTAGYAPLNFVSGGNFDDLGETHSDRDARSFGVVAGVLFSI